MTEAENICKTFGFALLTCLHPLESSNFTHRWCLHGVWSNGLGSQDPGRAGFMALWLMQTPGPSSEEPCTWVLELHSHLFEIHSNFISWFVFCDVGEENGACTWDLEPQLKHSPASLNSLNRSLVSCSPAPWDLSQPSFPLPSSALGSRPPFMLWGFSGQQHRRSGSCARVLQYPEAANGQGPLLPWLAGTLCLLPILNASTL